MWKGQGLSFQVEKTLFQDKSLFQVYHLLWYRCAFTVFPKPALFLVTTELRCLQDVCVFQTQAFGKVLVLDGMYVAFVTPKYVTALLDYELHASQRQVLFSALKKMSLHTKR